MLIVNNSARDISMPFRDGRVIYVPAGGSKTLADTDYMYLDDTQPLLNLFSTGLLGLFNTDGSAWSGAALPATPRPPLVVGTSDVKADKYNRLRRVDNGGFAGDLAPGMSWQKRRRLTKGPRIGRFNTAAITADHTTHVQTVLECPFDTIRIGIANVVNAPLTNVRVSAGCTPTLGANNSSASITPGVTSPDSATGIQQMTFVQTNPITFTAAIANAATGTLTAAWPDQSGTFIVTFDTGVQKTATFTSGSTTVSWIGNVTTATANATARGNFRYGTIAACNLLPVSQQLSNPSITWTDWFTVPSIPRTDGGTLPVICVRVEVPYSSGANPNIPVYYFNDTTTAGWENEGSASANVAPYGRPYRMRTQSGVLGVTSSGTFTSTATSFAGIPIFIQYIAKGQVVGMTFAQFGDSIDEGNPSAAGLRGHGIGLRAQRDLSTPSRPIEHCLLTVAGGGTSLISSRSLNLLTRDLGLYPDLIMSPIGSPNDFHASTPISFTAPLVNTTTPTLSAAWAGTTGIYRLFFDDGSGSNSIAECNATLTNGSTAVTLPIAVTSSANALATSWHSDLYSMQFSRGSAEKNFNETDAAICWRTILPVNAANSSMQYADVKRRQYNSDLTSAPQSSKVWVHDTAALLSGPLDAFGQTTLTNTWDNLHPSDAGNELWWQDLRLKVFEPYLNQFVSYPTA